MIDEPVKCEAHVVDFANARDVGIAMNASCDCPTQTSKATSGPPAEHPMNATYFDNMRERYISLFSEEPASDGAMNAIESALNLLLPDDLKDVGQFFGGGILGGKSHNTLQPTGPATNVVDETLRLRAAIKLPHRFVVLAEPPESLIVLDTESRAIGAPAVIWCDSCDVMRLDDVSAMATPPKTWPSYSAFFECLLDEEEQERGDA